MNNSIPTSFITWIKWNKNTSYQNTCKDKQIDMPISMKEIEFYFKSLQKEISRDRWFNWLTLPHILWRNNTNYQQSLQRNKRRKTSQIISWVPHYPNIKTKILQRTNIPHEQRQKVLNKMLANQTQKYIKRVIHHDQECKADLAFINQSR